MKKGSSVLDLIRNILIIVYAVFALFPLFWMLLISFKKDSEMFNTGFIFTPTLVNYIDLFKNGNYIWYFIDNIIISFGAVAIAVLVGVPAAYALARYDFKGREDIAFTFLSFRFAPEMLVILPLFLIYQRIGLYDTFTGLIWVYQLISIPLIIWILRGYFEEISPEIEYAAQLDGYTWWQVFLKFLLPLIKPGLVAASLLAFIYTWNDFTFPLLLAGERVVTVTVTSLSYISSESIRYGQMAAAATIAALPEVIFALFIQKHLVRGLSLGAIKG